MTTPEPELSDGRIADYELAALIERARLDDKPLSLRALLELQALRRSPKREDVIEECAKVLDKRAMEVTVTGTEYNQGYKNAILADVITLRALKEQP